MICIRQGFNLRMYLLRFAKSKSFKYNLSASKYCSLVKDLQYPPALNTELFTSKVEEDSSDTLTDIIPPILKTDYLPYVHAEVGIIRCRKELRELIKRKGEAMESTLLVSILEKMMEFLHSEKWTNQQKLEIMKSKEFDILLRTLHKNLSEISGNDLVKIVGFLMRMEISRESTLYQDIYNLIIENLESISFYKAAVLLNFLQRRNIRKGKLNFALKSKLEYHMTEKINELCPDDLIIALYYGKYNNFSPESMIKVLYALLEFKRYWKEPGVIADFFKILHTLPPDRHFEFTEIRMNFFEILKEMKENKNYGISFSNFLYIYGNMVYKNKTEYKPDLIDDLVGTVMEANIPVAAKMNCLKGLVIMDHNCDFFIEHMTNLILSEENFFKEDYEGLMFFLQALGNCNYSHVKPLEWWTVKNYLENLKNWKDEKNKWKELGLDNALSVAVYLVSLGIYVDKFLQPLSLEFHKNHEILKSSLGRLKMILLLNEALLTLEPNHSTHFRFLSKEREEVFKNKLKTTKTRGSEERLRSLIELKEILESAVDQKNCALEKRQTFHGVDIDITVAVDENGVPYDFSQVNDFRNKFCLEDFNLPSKFKLVLIFIVPKTDYSRNTFTLKPQFALKVKTLRAMGFKTLIVLEHEWSKVPDSEKGTYLWKLIRDKRNNLISNQSLIFFDKNRGLSDEIITQYFELEDLDESDVEYSEQAVR